MLGIQERTVGGGIDCGRPLNRREQGAEELWTAGESGGLTKEIPASAHWIIITRLRLQVGNWRHLCVWGRRNYRLDGALT